MLFGWLTDKLFKGRRESADEETQRVWAEWDTRRVAAEEAGQPFEEVQPEKPRQRRRRWRRGRPSAADAAAVGVTGAFIAGPPIDHGHGHGGYDGGFHGGGFHGGGDAGGGF